LAWQKFASETEDFPVGAIISGGVADPLPDDVIAAYDAPFPDDTYKAGARIFPALVPSTPDDPATADNEAAWRVLETLRIPFLCAFSNSDPITKGGDAPFLAKIPGAQGREHVTIEGAAHFLQEDRGPKLAQVI